MTISPANALFLDSLGNKTHIQCYDASGISYDELNVGETNKTDNLLPAINRLLNKAGIKPRELEIFGFNVGPGSFTGQRIYSTLALALGKFLKTRIYAVPAVWIALRLAGFPVEEWIRSPDGTPKIDGTEPIIVQPSYRGHWFLSSFLADGNTIGQSVPSEQARKLIRERGAKAIFYGAPAEENGLPIEQPSASVVADLAMATAEKFLTDRPFPIYAAEPAVIRNRSER